MMKKIYSVIAAVLAFCALVPNVSAQDWQGYKDLRFRKYVSEPDLHGVYTITLESFLNGDAQMKALPCDVVLVLDMSGSMRWPMGRDESGNTSDERKHAMQAGVKAFIEAIDDNDKYLPLPEGADPDTERIPRPNGRLGNRIGLITFAGSVSTLQDIIYLGDSNDPTNINKDNGKQTLISKINNLGNPNGGTRADYGMQRAYNWLNGLSADRKIRTAVLFTDGSPGDGNYWNNGTTAQQNLTWDTANAVINTANNIRNIGTAANKIKSKVYTISIIAEASMTDYVKVYLGKSSSNWQNATSMGTRAQWNNLSNIWDAGGENKGTQVAGPNPTNMTANGNYAFQTVSAAELKTIFEKIAGESGGSSEASASSTTQVDVISSSFMLPEGATKNDIKLYTVRYTGDQNGIPQFKQKAVTVGTQTTYVDDLVAVPTSGETYTWIEKKDDGTEVTHTESVDANIDWKLLPESSDKPNQISITKFDYANLWCGPDDSVLGGPYPGWHQGYKLVVKIPIKMATNAVGGPNLNTNEENSGFIINGTLVAKFDKPHLSLPVNIHIQKEGLAVGESAKFTIQRKTADAANWDYVTSVFVTRTTEAETSPIVKVIGLPATDETNTNAYTYRVVEDNWNWEYKLTSIQDSNGTEIGNKATRSATTDDLVINPFIFVNKKKDNIEARIKNAESKAMNIFTTGETEGHYTDSKER